MSRSGWFALRVLAVTVASLAGLAPASFGQAASLSSESLESNPLLGAGQETSFGAFTCNKSGTTTISFEARGSALGTYVGTFVETGSFSIGPQTDTSIDTRGVGAIINFQATFTIVSEFPVGTVTGTKQLSPTAPTGSSLAAFGSCDPTGSSPPNDVVAAISNPHLLYDAQIDATTGSRTDSGRAGLVIRSMPPAPSTTTFQQVFTSSEPAPPPAGCSEDDQGEDDDQGGRPGRGRRQGGHRDDDDPGEDCDLDEEQ